MGFMEFVDQKIKNLRKKICYWQYMYHVQNESEITDEEYDIFLDILKQLELDYPDYNEKTSPTYRVGGVVQDGFQKVYHQIPMLSLNSIIHQSQLLLFDKRIKNRLNTSIKNIAYCCELKLDGVAISLLYKQGKLIQAATRGDGKIGEDVTKNAYTILSIPTQLKSNNNNYPDLLEVRGEVFISKSCFLTLNQTMLKKNFKLFSNSRNAASGSLRQLDSNVTALRPLSFYCYGISNYIGKNKLPNSHQERLRLCYDWGIPINDCIRLVYHIHDIQKFYDYVREIRSDLKFNIDGIVIKVNNCTYQNQLGFNTRAVNWAVAYKFPADLQVTKLNKVIFQIGRTGLITPIACVEPVLVNDVCIKKVNLHNISEIKRLNLKIGDTVFIKRSGDVIPKISKVIHSESVNISNIVKIPRFCPSCHSVLKSKTHRPFVLYCTATSTCLAQRKAILRHFASRKAMNIQGIGENTINQLVNRNLVRTPVDFFTLNEEKLLHLDGYGVKSITKLLKAIDIAKYTTLSRFIYALGIPNVGEAAAKQLAIVFKTIENLIESDVCILSNIKYIGRIGALDIYEFFRHPNNLKNVRDLIHSNIGIRWRID